MNVLITSVGRRAYMVEYFKKALGENGKVFVSNSDDNTVAFERADDYVITPLIYDEKYIPFLLQYCKRNSIDFLISLFDMDLLILARNKHLFENIGTKVIVSDESVVEICNDKWKTYLFLSEHNFLTPKTFIKIENVIEALKKGLITYPIIVKPRFGCGSIGIDIAYDDDDLFFLEKKIKRKINTSYLKYESSSTNDCVLFQEFIKGQEYGIDVINDLDGNYRNAIFKKKIAMRAGETDIAQIEEMPVSITNEIERLGKLTKHIANMDVDVIVVDEKPNIIEMNARFGGGYPFSHMAGCDLPKAIIYWLKKEDVYLSLISARKNAIGYKELVITEKGQ